MGGPLERVAHAAAGLSTYKHKPRNLRKAISRAIPFAVLVVARFPVPCDNGADRIAQRAYGNDYGTVSHGRESILIRQF